MKNLVTPSFLKKYHPALLRWYDKHHRKLPWRDSDDAYAIWISEVMLQQTQVRTVIPYYTRFMNRYPTVQKLANARQQTVLKLWEGLGYYGRARNMHRTAKTIVQEYDGKLPGDWRQIRSLPGIGDYIAAAVLSIAFNLPFAVLDGNVKRVISRIFCMDSPINQSSSKKEFSLIADQMLYRAESGLYNQAVMELGALVCTPNKPVCDNCPTNFLCKAYQTSSVPVFPKRIKSKATPSHKMVSAVIIRDDNFLITQRPENGLLGGLWEFPGGQILVGEGTREACIRCVKESTGLNIEIHDYLTSVKHAYTHFKIEMDVFLCRTNSSIIRLNGPIGYRWIGFDEIRKYPLHKAIHKFIPHLIEAWNKLKAC